MSYEGDKHLMWG